MGVPSHTRRVPRWVVVLFVAAVSWSMLAGPAVAAADVTPPPTPSGVTATATSGGGGLAGTTFDGESGDLSGVSYSRRASVVAVAARNGAYGLRVASTNARAYARWDSDVVEQNHRWSLARFWVRVNSRGAGQSVDLLTISNTLSTRNFDFFVTGDTQRFKWDLHSSSADESSFPVVLGRWYFIEARVSYGGGNDTAQVRIDGVDQGTILSAGTASRVRGATFGAFAAKTHSQDYDDFVFQVGDEQPSWVPVGGSDPTVTVNWNAVVDSGSGLREYQIWRNGGWYDWVPAGTTAYVDDAPVDGAFYQLRAVDNAVNSSGWSARAYVDDPGPGPDTTPPPAPTNLALNDNGNGTVTLSWAPVVDTGGSGLREYAIYRNGRWYGWVPAPTVQFVDHAPVAGASYRVRAWDQALNRSPYSAPIFL